MSQHANHTFTTGQVTGMLGISLSSLQLYIREYRDYLSDTACQQKQGRRFTGEDIECLMKIRNLRFRRADKETVILALQGKYTIDEPVYKVQDMARLAATMQDTEIRIAGQAREITKQERRIDATRSHVEYLLKVLTDAKDTGELELIENMSLEIKSLREELARVKMLAGVHQMNYLTIFDLIRAFFTWW